MEDSSNEVHVDGAVEWPVMNKFYILRDYRVLLPQPCVTDEDAIKTDCMMPQILNNFDANQCLQRGAQR